MNIQIGRRYSCRVPVTLADHLAGFRRGVRVFEDHEFELTRIVFHNGLDPARPVGAGLESARLEQAIRAD